MKFLKGGMILLSVFVMSLICPIGVKAQSENRALDGVYIGTTDISGLTEAEALAWVQADVEARLDDQITFTGSDYSFTTSAGSLGYTWLESERLVSEAVSYGKSGNIISKYKIRKDLEQEPKVFAMDTTLDTTTVQEILEDHGSVHDVAVRNMSLRHEDDGSFTVLPGEAGRQLNVGASVNTAMWFMKNEWNGGDATIELVEEYPQPSGDAEQLLQVQDLLGTCYTEYGNGSSSRGVNVKNGAAKINGTVLYPGESFSFLDAMLPFTEENGYDKGKSYENGRVIESIGGGVCQVSSTLYVALIRAELQIDVRYCHSMRVGYVAPSMDAAVAEYSKDLIFTNNLEYPVYIEATTDGWAVKVSVYGKETRNPDREVDFEYEILPNEDPDIEMKAVLWKIVTEQGEETRTEFNHSTYYVPETDGEEEGATSEEDSAE